VASVDGARLRAFRVALGMNQYDLMLRINDIIGEDLVREPHVSGWETGNRPYTVYKAAVVSLLYEANPHAALKFLLGKSDTIVGIPVDRLTTALSEALSARAAYKGAKKAQRRVDAVSGRSSGASEEPRKRRGGT
jgi:hypothetical protein